MQLEFGKYKGTDIADVPEDYLLWLIGNSQQKINLYNDDAMKSQWIGWGDNCDIGLVQDFAAAIRERRDPAASGYDGLKAVEVTVAASGKRASGVRVTGDAVIVYEAALPL